MNRRNNAGKREREARKRHRRAVVVTWPDGTEAVRLKLGRARALGSCTGGDTVDRPSPY